MKKFKNEGSSANFSQSSSDAHASKEKNSGDFGIFGCPWTLFLCCDHPIKQ